MTNPSFSCILITVVSVTCIAWFSEDRPFAVGYFDGKLLMGTKEPAEKGGVVLIDAHKVKAIFSMVAFLDFFIVVLFGSRVSSTVFLTGHL